MKISTWLPQISWIALSLAYRAKAWAQNWMAALVASSTSATLNRKSFMSVAPGFMGRTVKTSRDSPTFVQPLMVTAAAKMGGLSAACPLGSHSCPSKLRLGQLAL